MNRDRLLAMFDELATETRQALNALDDWGESGQRASQYRHDVVADDIIVPRLVGAGLAVLSEESGIVGQGPLTVVVDPVDGSTNGALRLPWFATSLCAVDEDGPLVSLVANLATDHRFRASRDEGVEEAEASTGYGPATGPSACRQLSDAVVGVSGLPPEPGGWRQYRALGAAALDLCAVATGRLDGFIDIDRAHGVWDYLGAALVCREAGAPMVDAAGEELVILDPAARRAPVAAATPELLDQLVALARRWRPLRPADSRPTA